MTPAGPARPEYPGRAPRLALVAAALIVAVALFVFVVPVRRGLFDLHVYTGAVTHWADGGDLYGWVKPGTKYGFTYPPFAALLMLPLSVSWPVTVVGYVLGSVAVLALLLPWLAGPVARYVDQPRWFTLAVAVGLLGMYEPLRDTLGFGQVNLFLLALVLFDARLVARGSRYAGIAIGLATAIKLTPAVFIGYLLLARRWRAAALATGTATVATLLAALVAPEASRRFWADALWQLDRVGVLGYISNQSLRGVSARLDGGRTLWLVLVAVALVVWAVRVRRAVAAGDQAGAVALTGVLGCLISPVTWIHHLVWLLPALSILATEAARTRRPRLLWSAVAGYTILCSSVVWLWRFDASGVDGFLLGNLYVWVSLALLFRLPLAGAAATPGQVGQGQAVSVQPEATDHAGGHG